MGRSKAQKTPKVEVALVLKGDEMTPAQWLELSEEGHKKIAEGPEAPQYFYDMHYPYLQPSNPNYEGNKIGSDDDESDTELPLRQAEIDAAAGTRKQRRNYTKRLNPEHGDFDKDEMCNRNAHSGNHGSNHFGKHGSGGRNDHSRPDHGHSKAHGCGTKAGRNPTATAGPKSVGQRNSYKGSVGR